MQLRLAMEHNELITLQYIQHYRTTGVLDVIKKMLYELEFWEDHSEHIRVQKNVFHNWERVINRVEVLLFIT